MKLLVAIVSNEDGNNVTGALTKAGYALTKLATVGGFLHSGSTTILIGADDEKVDDILSIIGKYSKQRQKLIPAAVSAGMEIFTSMPVEVTVGGANVFILNVEQFVKL